MNSRLQGGAIKLIVAATVAVMYFRGYFTDWVNVAATALQTPPVKSPFGPPGASLPSVTGAAPTSGRSRGGTF